jgi:hypothetical protein
VSSDLFVYPLVHPPTPHKHLWQRYLLYSDHGVAYRKESALEWFHDILPTLPEDQQPQQCVANVGDIMFIPRGWWHAVRNFADNIAFTANFVGKDLHSISETVATLHHQLKRKGNAIPREVLAPCAAQLQILGRGLSQKKKTRTKRTRGAEEL